MPFVEPWPRATAAPRERRTRSTARHHARTLVLASCLLLAAADRGAFAAPGDISTFAGPATIADLSPSNIAFDSAGNAYITDFANDRIHKVDPSGIISIFAGTGEEGFSGDGEPAIAARLQSPGGIVVNASDEVIFGDDTRIRKIDGDGIISTIAGTGPTGPIGHSGPATAVYIKVAFLALAPSGDIVFSDPSALRVRKITPDGMIGTVAGDGVTDGWGNGIGVVPEGGSALDASFRLPTGVAVAADGTVFIADMMMGKIWRVAPDGIITSFAGISDQPGNSGDGGPAAAARFSLLRGLAIDASGALFLADWANHRVRVIDPTGIIRAVAGTGTAGFSGDGGPSAAAQLNGPWGLAFDAAGNLYIADVSNRRIRKVDAPFVTVPMCGNSLIETGETCDDGNTASGDCCSALCKLEPDADSDGTCDGLDVCSNVGGAQTFLVKPKPSLTLSRIGSDATPADDQLALNATFTLPVAASFADLQPIEHGVRLAIDSASAVRKVDVAIPGGAYDPFTRSGWIQSGNARTWTFLDRRATPANGIVKVVLADKSRSSAPRQVKITVKGRSGSYPIVNADRPVTAIVALGNAADAAAGLCAESAFDAPSDCLFNRGGNTLVCRKR